MPLPRPIEWLLLALAFVAVYVAGLRVDVMDVDASQYASISLEMLHNGEYLQVQHLGQDYLDKPPLLFWTSTLAFKLFGVHNWSYKLFSLLFSLLGVYSTYRFARLYYPQEIGVWAALMLASCQALFLINNDVRTDTMLVGAVIFAVWQISTVLRGGGWLYIIGAAMGIALAMLAKGPIGLMVPVLAFGSDWFFKRQWARFFRWQWLAVLALVALMLSPMVYGLYQQHGSFGPYFYFWAQSFGRLTGDNPFINSGISPQPPSPFFFVHTFLWSFLPWSLLAVGGLWQQLKSFVQSGLKVQPEQEVISLWGFVLPFIALSFSDYKLPHYIYVLFPFAAIMAARFAFSVWQAPIYRNTHLPLGGLLIILATVLVAWAFPSVSFWVWIVFGLLALGAFYGIVKANWLMACLWAMLATNWMLGAAIYPQILQYQSTSVAGKDIADLAPPKAIALLTRGHALDFYAGRIIPYYEAAPNDLAPGDYIYTNQQGLEMLQAAGYNVQLAVLYPYYKVTALAWPFINPTTRSSKLQARYLVWIGPEE